MTSDELADAIEAFQAEQITMNGRLDDLDFQVGEIRDLILQLLALHQQPEAP